MLETVLVLCVVGLPLFKWRQNELARMIPLVIISGIVSIIILVHGMNTPIFLIYDPITIAMGCLALWIGASLMWTDSHQSAWECQAWLSYLLLTYLARYADSMILLSFIMSTGIAFSIMALGFMVKHNYRGLIFNDDWISKFWYLFGNRVHIATLLIIPFFISLWAGLNIGWWWFIGSIIMGIYLSICRSRGAFIGIIAGLLYMLFIMKFYYLLIILGLFSALLAYIFRKKFTITSILTRLIYYKAAFEMIKKRYLYGFGLNMFRKVYPDLNPTLFKSEKIRKLIHDSGGVELATGHRPHNDLVDIAVEIGVLGLILFCSMFYFISWGSIDPIFIGAFVAYGVASMFFFPLREVHTAISFWVFTGILMGFGQGEPLLVHPFIGIVLILLICRVIYGAFIKFTGLYFFSLTQKENGGDNPLGNIKMAIGCDPYCARYLMFGFLFHVDKDPELAFEYAQRQLMHFDGGKVKWGVYDQFARALLRISGINAAEMYIRKALHINPEYPRSLELLGFVHKSKENIREVMKKQGGLPNGLGS